jgi:hypothetical protein
MWYLYNGSLNWVSGKVGELQRTVNPLPKAELVRIHPCPPCTVRLSVRTLPFHGSKRSSILLPCTKSIK